MAGDRRPLTLETITTYVRRAVATGDPELVALCDELLFCRMLANAHLLQLAHLVHGWQAAGADGGAAYGHCADQLEAVVAELEAAFRQGPSRLEP